MQYILLFFAVLLLIITIKPQWFFPQRKVRRWHTGLAAVIFVGLFLAVYPGSNPITTSPLEPGTQNGEGEIGEQPPSIDPGNTTDDEEVWVEPEDQNEHGDPQEQGEEPQAPGEDEPVFEEDGDIPEYSIVEKEEDFVGGNRRYHIRAAIDPFVDEAEIEAAARSITEQLKAENDFSAVVIFFYDHPEVIDDPYTVAKVEYAPDGVWSNAIHATPGEYENFEFIFNLGSVMSGLLPKDVPNYPTVEEVSIYAEIKSKLDSEENPIFEESPPGLSGEQLMEWMDDNQDRADAFYESVVGEIAENYNLTFEEADSVYLKVMMR